MADEKISAMVAATVVMAADDIPIVQALANKKSTRSLLLTGGTSESIYLTASVGFYAGLQDVKTATFFFVGTGLINGFSSGGWLMQGGPTPFPGQIVILASGGVEVTPKPGFMFEVRDFSAPNTLQWTPFSGVFNLNSTVQPVITYITTTPGSWLGAPTSIAVAIDRIAAKLAAMGGPIP